MFDVPDFLVPTLTELVTLLVFRQARRLVFGYDRRRVTNNDKAWREKAGRVRLVPLSELGAPQEYIPASSPRCGSTVEDGAERGARNEEDGEGGAVDADPTDREVVADSRSDNDGGPVDSGEPAGVDTDARLAGGQEPNSAAGGSAAVAASPAAKTTASACANAGGGTTAEDGQEEATPAAPSTDEGAAAAAAYARASREFERLGECATPAEMLDVVKAGMTLLSEEAARISGSDKPLDADSLLPLLVHSLAHANLPRVHEALNLLRNFQDAGWGGEQEYYVTCLEAAVSFVLAWGAPADPDADGDDDDNNAADTAKGSKAAAGKKLLARGDGSGGGSSSRNDATASGRRAARRAGEEEEEERDKGREALVRLGIFLEKHEVQEDTVDVLSSAGWL
ncbi:unnamed protein product [Ectocarpus fasciculatus]